MTTTAQEQQTLSSLLIGRWEQAGSKLFTLAEAFPEDKYEWSPVKGVRTFGDVLRHVSFWNQFVAASARGKQADESANELPKAKYSTKARVLDALRVSTADAASALRENELDMQTAEMVTTFLEHTSEHYGQLVVYARSMGVVPSASRG